MKQLTFIIIAAAVFAAALTVSGCVNRQPAESYSQFLDTAGTEYHPPGAEFHFRTLRGGLRADTIRNVTDAGENIFL